ncbi:GNAT family N-acetyltransferase [Roseivivax sp. CAU 1753]
MEAPRLDALLVTEGTLGPLLDLRVRDGEETLIAPVADWLAQAAHKDYAVSFGLYHGGIAVGLVSVIDPRLIPEDHREDFQPGCLYVWRLMIDRTQRGKSFGRGAVALATQYARTIGLDGVSLTTMESAAGNALAFYERLGFAPTGRRIDGEIELVLRTGT